MTQPPLVSVVVPCYNQSRYAYEAALSAKLSYSGPLEIILVNDGSTEPGTALRLEAVSRDLADHRCTIIVINQDNKGLPGARNAGISASNGEFIQLLDADDLIVSGKIDNQVEHLSISGEIDISITDFIEANEHLDVFDRHENIVSGFNYDINDFAFNWERGFSIPIHCALFKRSVFEATQFNESVKAKEDWVFWTTFVSLGRGRIAFLGTRAAIYRVHSNSMCRSMAGIGRQWLRASLEIDKVLGGKCPGFFEESLSWFNRVYANASTEISVDISRSVPITDNSLNFVATDIQALPVSLGGRPRLSVIVPVFNHFEFLGECLNSLARQDIKDLEVILVDDCSSDKRVAPLLSRYSLRNSLVTLIQNERNLGIARSQNIAVSAASGEFLAFLDCDDYLPDGALNAALSTIDARGGCDYFFSDRRDVDVEGNEIRTARYGGYADQRFVGDLRRDILNGMVASHLKIVRRSSFNDVNGFDPMFAGVQDWELALKLAEGGKFIYLPEVLYCHRIHNNSVTASDVRRQFQLTNVLRRKFSFRFLSVSHHEKRLQQATKRVLKDARIGVAGLAEAWQAGGVILDTTSGLTKEDLWFFREFNSYIDEIIWSAPEVYSSLLGYVWSPDILKRM